MNKLSELPIVESTCTCSTCVNCCEVRPCWPTPDEARKLIGAGFGGRLMRDWWIGDHYLEYDDLNINILCPAGVGLEGKSALDLPNLWGNMPKMRCTFLTADNRCELHDLGLKPIEGRCTDHSTKGASGIHEAVADAWNNPESQALVDEWERNV